MTDFKNDFLVSFQYQLTVSIREQIGVCEAEASRMATGVMAKIRGQFGGTEVYIPKRPPRQVQDAAVMEAFDGSNREEVCRRFGIGRRTFYDILARSRETCGG